MLDGVYIVLLATGDIILWLLGAFSAEATVSCLC